jgi:hypothetical protein
MHPRTQGSNGARWFGGRTLKRDGSKSNRNRALVGCVRRIYRGGRTPLIAKGCATHLVVPGACSPRADRRENGWIPHDWSLRWSRDREIGGLGVVAARRTRLRPLRNHTPSAKERPNSLKIVYPKNGA